MCIFKNITDRYCEKILAEYKLQAGEKTYKGYEAELLTQRNEFARCLVKTIKTIEIKESDYSTYFKEVLQEITSTLQIVTNAVAEHNKEFKTTFTTDLYESCFTSSLISFIHALRELHQKSPAILTDIKDESLFTNSRKIPWVYQSSFILYEYVLEREFEIATNKVKRDIFEPKKQLILKYIQNAASLSMRFENEDEPQYKDLMKVLLANMRSEEQDIQRRKTEDNSNTNNSYSYFPSAFLTQTFYKASEKLIGKSQLGQSIETLIREFDERTVTKALVCLT